MKYSEWENWLIETGDDIIHKKAATGWQNLSDAEKLTYCLWVLDYGMRNAGDVQTAADVFPEFQSEGETSARRLGLSDVAALFGDVNSLSQQSYFDAFDETCRSVSGALSGSESSGG
jgi:hypothetical protein